MVSSSAMMSEGSSSSNTNEIYCHCFLNSFFTLLLSYLPSHQEGAIPTFQFDRKFRDNQSTMIRVTVVTVIRDPPAKLGEWQIHVMLLAVSILYNVVLIYSQSIQLR